ncbi:MAG TPA: DUF4157 domain-containing protein, partial [Puia sp.]|nr:DUF4157 domain-containing protein [Puia sp.]
MLNLKNKTDRSKAAVQPKLAINVPGDRYEQEADAMADRVMGMDPLRAAVGGNIAVEGNSGAGMMVGEAGSAGAFSPGGMIGRSIQRKCAHCEEEEKKRKPLMRKMESGYGGGGVRGGLGAGGGVGLGVRGGGGGGLLSSLNNSAGGGTPLPQGTRGFMENAFSADFSGVRVHTGAKAAAMSKEIQARAFTYGNDVYFNDKEYNPHTRAGQQLLA